MLLISFAKFIRVSVTQRCHRIRLTQVVFMTRKTFFNIRQDLTPCSSLRLALYKQTSQNSFQSLAFSKRWILLILRAVTGTGITCKIIPCSMHAQPEGGVFLKKLKYFELTPNMFEFYSSLCN